MNKEALYLCMSTCVDEVHSTIVKALEDQAEGPFDFEPLLDRWTAVVDASGNEVFRFKEPTIFTTDTSPGEYTFQWTVSVPKADEE